MEHLPGCPHTLQGWNKVKHAIGAYVSPPLPFLR